MTTYKEIFGKYVKNYSSDPTSDAEGQVWYNTTSGTFKSVVAGASWSSGSPLITARRILSGAGTQTAALAFGGYIPPSGSALTEEYNGSGWANGGNLTTARWALGGAGTQTAGLAFGGFTGTVNTTATEEYDGTSWGPGGNMGTPRRALGGTGIQTAGLAFGGTQPGATAVTNTEEYDGSAWTAGGSLNTGRLGMTGVGTQTAGLGVGGSTTNLSPSIVSNTEEYDGSTWTAGGSLNTARRYLAGAGTQTAALGFGGYIVGDAYSSLTEKYDGTSWTTTTNLSVAKASLGGAGTQTAGLAFGGATPSLSATTEEYNVASTIITAAAWASGGAIGTALQDPTGFGLQTAAVIFGGETAPGAFVTTTQNYDGSTWTASGAYPISVTKSAAAGTQTSGLGIAGGNPYGVTTVSEYGGSTWTAGGAYPISVAALGGVGTQTAALGIAGDVFPTSPRYSTAVRSYDGSAWTTAPSLAGAGRYSNLTTGTQTAAMTAGGSSPGGSNITEVYNGVSWTSSGNLLNNRSSGGASRNAAYTNSLVFGTNGALAVTESFDGSIWSTAPNMATARYGAAGAGTGTLALAAGGRAPGFSTATEEFTGETTSANVKTITTS